MKISFNPASKISSNSNLKKINNVAFNGILKVKADVTCARDNITLDTSDIAFSEEYSLGSEDYIRVALRSGTPRNHLARRPMPSNFFDLSGKKDDARNDKQFVRVPVIKGLSPKQTADLVNIIKGHIEFDGYVDLTNDVYLNQVRKIATGGDVKLSDPGNIERIIDIFRLKKN